MAAFGNYEVIDIEVPLPYSGNGSVTLTADVPSPKKVLSATVTKAHGYSPSEDYMYLTQFAHPSADGTQVVVVGRNPSQSTGKIGVRVAVAEMGC